MPTNNSDARERAREVLEAARAKRSCDVPNGNLVTVECALDAMLAFATPRTEAVPDRGHVDDGAAAATVFSRLADEMRTEAVPAAGMEREGFRAAMVDAARARGGAGAEFIAKGESNLWLDIAYDAFATLPADEQAAAPRSEVSDEAVATAARRALGEWLAWPDAGRDGPVSVDNAQAISWLGGVAQKLAAAPTPQPASASAGERDDLTDRFWLVVREPGRVPDRKGPWKHSETAKVLREFMAANPTAFIDHLTIGHDGTPDVEHGPLVLQYTDGRSMSVGRKHNERVRAAALAALTPDAGQVEAGITDTERLNFLDECNQRLNARYGTNYRWELILNHNVTRLMLDRLVVDLNDSAANGMPSCRQAIDAAIRARSPASPDAQEAGK